MADLHHYAVAIALFMPSDASVLTRAALTVCFAETGEEARQIAIHDAGVEFPTMTVGSICHVEIEARGEG